MCIEWLYNTESGETFSNEMMGSESMVSDVTADERRGSERVTWQCHARLVPLSLETRPDALGLQHVTGRNISEGGLQVWTDRLFAIQSRLLVEMDSPGISEGFQAVGSVAWISPTPSEDQWCVGIEFSDVGDSALSSIRTLMNHESVAN
jgi:Tfp pilus assembly protein PilZ